jgi:hypothetical protein
MLLGIKNQLRFFLQALLGKQVPQHDVESRETTTLKLILRSVGRGYRITEASQPSEDRRCRLFFRKTTVSSCSRTRPGHKHQALITITMRRRDEAADQKI